MRQSTVVHRTHCNLSLEGRRLKLHLQSLDDIRKQFLNSFSPELFYTYIILSKTNIGGNILVTIHKYSFFPPLPLVKPILNTVRKIFITSFKIFGFQEKVTTSESVLRVEIIQVNVLKMFLLENFKYITVKLINCGN